MRYVPKVNLVFRLPTGQLLSYRCLPSWTLREAASHACPSLPERFRILYQAGVMPLDLSLGELGLANDAELEVLL